MKNRCKNSYITVIFSINTILELAKHLGVTEEEIEQDRQRINQRQSIGRTEKEGLRIFYKINH